MVDGNVARDSGGLVPNGFAQILGCDLGQKIEVDSEYGPITISWPLSSTTGASIGSLRQTLAHSGAECGDCLFIRATKLKISFERLGKATLQSVDSDIVRLGLLLGLKPPIDETGAIERIATALGISESSAEQNRMAVRRRLQSRGETDLADLVLTPSLTVDDYITNMGDLLAR